MPGFSMYHFSQQHAFRGEATLAEAHPTQKHLGCGDELVVDNPLGKQAIFISYNSGGGGVQLGQGGGVTQGFVAVVSCHAPRQAVGKPYQQGLPQACCAACLAGNMTLPHAGSKYVMQYFSVTVLYCDVAVPHYT